MTNLNSTDPVGIYTCPNFDCPNLGIEMDEPSKYCDICGQPLKVVIIPTTTKEG